MSYQDFLDRKRRMAPSVGVAVDDGDINPMLHVWQRRIVAWALRVGRAAIWADTGLGKTFMQIEWCRLTGGVALIVAPLAVCAQTVREASKLGVPMTYVRDGGQITGPGLWITNYEMATRFDPGMVDAVCLDEASILKQADGKTRTMLIQHFRDVRFRIACTATPAPNDPEELTSQAEFLGVMPRVEMLAAYFIHDSDGWRLKGHARRPMFEWMATWAVALRRPSDLGFPDDGYILPGINVVADVVEADIQVEGQLFATDLGGVGGRARVRRQTLEARIARSVDLVMGEPDEPWILWCGLNDEAAALNRAIPGSVNVTGSMSPEDKAAAFLGFAEGRIKYMICKPQIAAFGLNWQHCARMVFVGLNDSMETYYQAIRRCHRYGQTRVVQVHVVTSKLESQIAANVARKEQQAAKMIGELVHAMGSKSTVGIQ